jgi:uncharacterized protein (TIGR02246 family)
MKKAALLLITILGGFMAMAQNSSKDQQAIEKQIDAMFTSWNNHNYNDMDQYITPDCDWVNIVGMWWQGSKQVQFAHQAYHNAMFKNTSLTKKQVKIILLSNDVALVHLLSRVGSFTTPSGMVMPEGDDMATLVFVKKNNGWMLRAGENVTVNAEAEKFNPVLQMPK